MLVIKEQDVAFGKRIFTNSESDLAQKKMMDIMDSQKYKTYHEFYRRIFNFLEWNIKKDNEHLRNDKIYKQQDEARLSLLFFISVFYSANGNKLLAIEANRINQAIDKNRGKSKEETLGEIKKKLFLLNNDLGVFSEYLFSNLTISGRSLRALLIVVLIFLDVIEAINRIEDTTQMIWQNWKNSQK